MKKDNKTPEMSQQEIDKKTDGKIYEAFRLLESNNLLYFRFLKRMNFIVDKGFKAIGGVGYHEKKKKIFVILQEKAMLASTELNYDDPAYMEAAKDVAGLLEHETGHVLYDHIFHKDVKIDHTLKNIAEDYIINDGCTFISSRLRHIQAEKSTSILKGGCFFEEIKAKVPALKSRDIQEITSVELYRILKDYKQSQKEKKKEENQENPMKQQINDLLSQIDEKIKEQSKTLDPQSLESQNALLEKQKELTLRLKKLKMKEEAKVSVQASKDQELVANTLDKGE